jgi:hypothetical protein
MTVTPFDLFEPMDYVSFDRTTRILRTYVAGAIISEWVIEEEDADDCSTQPRYITASLLGAVSTERLPDA